MPTAPAGTGASLPAQPTSTSTTTPTDGTAQLGGAPGTQGLPPVPDFITQSFVAAGSKETAGQPQVVYVQVPAYAQTPQYAVSDPAQGARSFMPYPDPGLPPTPSFYPPGYPGQYPGQYRRLPDLGQLIARCTPKQMLCCPPPAQVPVPGDPGCAPGPDGPVQGPAPADPVQQTPPVAEKPARPDYTVQPGDSLSVIAEKHGDITWRQLYWANRDQIENPDLIYAGQVLKIPNCDLEVPDFPYTPMFPSEPSKGSSEPAPAPAPPAEPAKGDPTQGKGDPTQGKVEEPPAPPPPPPAPTPVQQDPGQKG